MNKNIHIINYAIIFSSLFILFFLQFNSAKENNNVVFSNEKIDTLVTAENLDDIVVSNHLNNIGDSTTLKIAYVNSDTVSKYYKFAQKVQATLLNKRSAAEKQIKNKYQSYEDLVRDFEKASPIMGEREKMEKAQKIRLLEQEIMQVEQQLSEQLANEEVRMTQTYILKTNEYMQTIGKKLGFDFVLSYRIGGPMLYANSNLDITSEIIELLNNKYQSTN